MCTARDLSVTLSAVSNQIDTSVLQLALSVCLAIAADSRVEPLADHSTRLSQVALSPIVSKGLSPTIKGGADCGAVACQRSVREACVHDMRMAAQAALRVNQWLVCGFEVISVSCN